MIFTHEYKIYKKKTLTLSVSSTVQEEEEEVKNIYLLCFALLCRVVWSVYFTLSVTLSSGPSTWAGISSPVTVTSLSVTTRRLCQRSSILTGPGWLMMKQRYGTVLKVLVSHTLEPLSLTVSSQDHPNTLLCLSLAGWNLSQVWILPSWALLR